MQICKYGSVLGGGGIITVCGCKCTQESWCIHYHGFKSDHIYCDFNPGTLTVLISISQFAKRSFELHLCYYSPANSPNVVQGTFPEYIS